MLLVAVNLDFNLPLSAISVRLCQGMASAFKFLECTIFQALTENSVFISTQFRSFFLGLQK
jgi:branched-subunit amino acid transport protein